jgi:hypothetical protein
MIILIKNSMICSTYWPKDIPLSTMIELSSKGFSVLETPDDNRISFEIGEKSPMDQEIDNNIKAEIRIRTARLNRKIREETGILWKKFLIKPTTETLSSLVMAKSQLQQGNISRVPWRFDDGNFQELTMDDLDELIKIVSQTIQENFSNERQEVMS